MRLSENHGILKEKKKYWKKAFLRFFKKKMHLGNSVKYKITYRFNIKALPYQNIKTLPYSLLASSF